MKLQKQTYWEKYSEGLIMASEIEELDKYRQPITIVLENRDPNTQKRIGSILIYSNKKGCYDISDSITGEKTERPYKYLGFAVRRAVKMYKAALKTGNWKAISKL